MLLYFAFIALTLLVGQQEGHLACKNWGLIYWHGYLSGVRCKWFAYGPADVTITPSSLAPAGLDHPWGWWGWSLRARATIASHKWSSWCRHHSIISCSSKIQNALPFWCWLTQIVLEKAVKQMSYCSSNMLLCITCDTVHRMFGI